MSIRAFGTAWSALLFLFAQGAWAQSTEEIQEFDLGDAWVDSSNEGGWFAPWSSIPSTGASGFRLDLSGGTGFRRLRKAQQQTDDQSFDQFVSEREYYALATVQVPLDRLLLGSRRRDPSQSLGEDDALLYAQHVDSSSRETEPVTSSHPKGESEAPGRRSPPSSRGRVQESEPTQSESTLRPQVDEQPSLPEHQDFSTHEGPERFGTEEVLLAARAIADRVGHSMTSAERRIRSLVRRSRWSGLSPEVRLRGVLGFDRATSTEESVGIYPGDTTVRGGRDSLAEVRLTFRLDQLVLGNGESSLERQRIELMEDRRKLIKDALDIFSEWRRAALRAEDVSLPPDERMDAMVDAETALAQLHLMTDGWFEGDRTLRQLSREIPRAGRGDPEKGASR